MSTQHYLLTILLLLFLPFVTWSQRSFLDILSQYETWDNHAIAPTQGNGFLIGNDLKFPPADWERHGFYLSKYDSCGLIAWSKAYGSPDQALFFSDLTELSNGDAIAMGQTGFDNLFLMRIDPDGNVLNLFTYDTSNGDQNYNLDVHNGKVMVFGSYYADNGSRNFLLVVNEDGQIDWAKSFHPRLGAGGAISCGDGSFVCVNGNMVYKVNESGNLEWSQEIVSLSPEAANLSKPVESGNGYVLAVRNPERASQYLIKLNRSGQVQWQSDEIPSGFLASSVDRLSNGNLVLVNAQPIDGEGLSGGAPLLAEFTPDGTLVQQYGFELDNFGRFTAPVCRAGDNGSLTIKGSYYDQGNFDYIIRLKPEEDLSCAGYPYEDVLSEHTSLDLRSASANVSNLRFSSADTTEVQVIDLGLNPENYCEKTVDDGVMDFSDRLQCVDTLTFTPPFAEATYLWEDGSTNGQRILKAPGQYLLKATTCRTKFDIDIELELGLCPCTYYIPNAFSPNGDGVNDQFQAFATCAFTSYDLQIFNRWGELLHRSQTPEDGWDGRSRGRLLEQGMYMYALKYSWEVKPGVFQDRMETGTVAIVR
ncbi:gliding motility-associated C-terminal domain-containing protein [Flavilitoribacter nigricans]|nr:gliding motility-associated C-terminal domain-containing protein [Flavilitoribacter nigricans]